MIRFAGGRPIETKVKTKNKLFFSFLKGCFQWDPKKRMTPNEALSHEWILEGLPEGLRKEHLLTLKIPVDVIAFSF